MQEAGHTIDSGMDIYIYGNIPNGSGLSSSSSLELLIGVIAEKLYDLKLERLDLVKIGKQTENDFIGVNSGIMDQFAIGMGADQRAIYLDTNTLEYDLVPLDLKDNVVVIMNTINVVNWLILNTMNVVLNVKQQYLNSKKNLISKHLVNWTSGHSMHTAT